MYNANIIENLYTLENYLNLFIIEIYTQVGSLGSLVKSGWDFKKTLIKCTIIAESVPRKLQKSERKMLTS